MSWKENAVALFRRFGAPAKFAAKLIVGSLPYGSVAVDLVGQMLDCVHETVKDQIEIEEAKLPPATAADLKRVEDILGVLVGDLADVTAKVAAKANQPVEAAQVLKLALATDDRCKAALDKLDQLARGIEGLHAKADQMNAKLDELLRRSNVPLLENQGQGAPISTRPTTTAARQTIAEDRETFLRIVQDYTSVLVRDRYARILDEFIRWSEARAGALEYQPRGQRQQATFTYRLAGEPIVFWDAYPRKTDGAKFIALPDLPGQRVPEELREKLRQAFAKFENQETGADKPIPTLSFRTLEVEETRNEVKRCLEQVLASLRPLGMYTNSLDMKFAWIPPGAFLMGSPANEPKRESYPGADETQHGVTLTKGFHLGIYPVTQAQWQAVMDGNPSHFKGDRLPVEKVSWNDAKAFCKSLGRIDGRTYCLPTEAQWEYACRAGTTTPFHFGDAISTNQVNHGKSRMKTTQVGSFPHNAWGLFDMHGNVWEWCADSFGPYPKQELKDPQYFVASDACVLRGGSYFDQPEFCRSAFRARRPPADRFSYIGLRVCLLLD